MNTLPHPLTLRNATDADAPFCQALYASTRDDLRQLAAPPAMIEQLIAMQQHVHEQGRRGAWPLAELFIVEEAGVPVGRVVLDTQGASWRLVELALAPHARGRGIGTVVLGALLRRARAAGAAIGLAVRPANTSALRLYQRAGFVVVSSDALHHEMAWHPAAA